MEMPSAAMASSSDAAAYLSERVRHVVPHDDRKDAAVCDVNDHALRRTCAARARGASGLGPNVDFRRRVPGRLGGFPALAAFAQWLLMRSGAVSD
jgi:hypothetical protein